MPLVVAAVFTNSMEAGVASSRLEADGIPSFLFDLNVSAEGASFLMPIRLMVDEEDIDEVRRILGDT